MANKTSFSVVYDLFFSKITDDMYMEFNELDTYRMLQDLIVSAIPKFEFPKHLIEYELLELADFSTYTGVNSDYMEVPAKIYSGGYFTSDVTPEEANIIAVYMVVEWLSQQLASIENTRMKFSGTDFKLSSQASHMSKILNMKSDYEREGFHLQRLYKRRRVDQNGNVRSTMDLIMKPYSEDGYGTQI